MKAKIKISVLAVISGCLFFLTSFVNSNPHDMPSVYVLCEMDPMPQQSYSKVSDIIDVDCTVCELVRIVKLWNGDGLLEGTLYEYDSGSEPAIWPKIECQDSRDFTDKCTVLNINSFGSNCTNYFIPCTKEEDAECIHD